MSDDVTRMLDAMAAHYPPLPPLVKKPPGYLSLSDLERAAEAAVQGASWWLYPAITMVKRGHQHWECREGCCKAVTKLKLGLFASEEDALYAGHQIETVLHMPGGIYRDTAESKVIKQHFGLTVTKAFILVAHGYRAVKE